MVEPPQIMTAQALHSQTAKFSSINHLMENGLWMKTSIGGQQPVGADVRSHGSI